MRDATAVRRIAVVAALLFAGAACGTSSDSQADKTPQALTAADLTAMSCADLEVLHTGHSAVLARHVDDIYTSSWNTDQAQRRLASDPTRAILTENVRLVGQALDATCLR